MPSHLLVSEPEPEPVTVAVTEIPGSLLRFSVSVSDSVSDSVSGCDQVDIPYLSYILFSMWEVWEHRRVDRQLDRLPTDVLKRYEKWKDIVTISGPKGLKLIRGFRDEALKGKWNGHRSSRLGRQYRVLYRVEGKRLVVEVVRITPHDYGRNE